MSKPTNVRITRADGTTLPCELVHLGPDTDGIDIWQIANAEYHPEHGDTLSADTLPGRTGLCCATPMLQHDSTIDMPRRRRRWW